MSEKTKEQKEDDIFDMFRGGMTEACCVEMMALDQAREEMDTHDPAFNARFNEILRERYKSLSERGALKEPLPYWIDEATNGKL